MKKLLMLTCCFVLAASFFAGCGQEEAQEPADTPAAGAVEEVADSTRLDSAAQMVDSAAAAIEEEAKDAAEEAVEEVTGH